ncbi:hypothetical protein KUW19_07115 [Ferrimonas balearica]|uniref:hypothetical protein n=1 Tax=Ferrimonas balearica TaxID=44012 RepID=UPI001C9512AC|nr:hypothetical protein [Ferrimonas balearica]MBY6106261.1 hypothetical protein [Ferrimonas balearica]
MEYVLTIITGVVSGVAASALFLWFSFSYLKPKVEISPHLAVNEEGSKSPYIEIKFLNRASRALNDVRVELLFSELRNAGGGTLFHHTELISRKVYHVAPYDKKDKDARYAFRFTEYKEIRDKWKSDDKDFITIMIHATDAMSGFSQSFRKELRNINESVKVGTHDFGESFKVVRKT